MKYRIREHPKGKYTAEFFADCLINPTWIPLYLSNQAPMLAFDTSCIEGQMRAIEWHKEATEAALVDRIVYEE